MFKHNQQSINANQQFAGWCLKGSSEEFLEMISSCIIFETNIFIEKIICVGIDLRKA